jgi:thiol peroxidase
MTRFALFGSMMLTALGVLAWAQDKDAPKEGQERKGVVTMRGNPVTLLGPALKAGDDAPSFTAVANDLKPFDFNPKSGKVTIISAVPSLDTPVCSTETRRFNQEAAGLGDIQIVTISMDLPFAQKRWCGAEGIKAVTTVSDYRDRAFGQAYGVLMKETKLLARAVFVVGKDGRIAYEQIVPEIASEPDYAAVIAAAKAAAAK